MFAAIKVDKDQGNVLSYAMCLFNCVVLRVKLKTGEFEFEEKKRRLEVKQEMCCVFGVSSALHADKMLTGNNVVFVQT